MRLTKGCKVEVLSDEAPTGAWICAEIVSGNGRMYTVRYDGFRMSSEGVVEKVPRKAIRPRPPPVIGADNWVPGDLVEVFHNQSWKTARVIEVMGFTNFSVGLLESFEEFSVHRSHLRVRQCWRDGKWFLLGHAADDCCQRPDVVSIRTLKRGSPHGSCFLEAAKRPRIMAKDGCHQQMLPGHLFEVSQKVDAFVSLHEKMGENYMHFPISAQTNGFSYIYTGSRNYDSVIESSISVDTVSCASSIGSCSAVGNDFCNFSCGSITHYRNKLEDCISDAESCIGGTYEEERCPVPINDELGAVDCRSELLAYRCVLEALYACGPLSWEEEAKMMDLRNALNISDDEHLREIRNLISANASLSVR